MILGYVRVSTGEQADDRKTSLENQENIIRQYALVQGVTKFDVQIYTDAGISGSVRMKDREAGAKLLADVQAGDTVIAAKMDRIFRSSIDALQTIETLKEKGADLVLFDMGLQSVMRDGPSKLFFSMLAAFAEFERGRISERITTGKYLKRKKGGYTGGPAPFGYRIVGRGQDSKLELDEREQQVLAIVRDRAVGVPLYNTTQLTAAINQAGFRNRVGNPYPSSHIKRIADNLRAVA